MRARKTKNAGLRTGTVKPSSGIERGRGRERDKGLFVAFSHMRASDEELKLFGIPEDTKDDIA